MQVLINESMTNRVFEEHLKQFASLKTDVDIAKGRATQSSVLIAYALTVISLVLSAVSLFR